MEKVSEFTFGVDLGDRRSAIYVLKTSGEIVEKLNVTTNKKAFKKYFVNYAGQLVAIENGTHSPWVSRLLKELGCQVLVGNARKLPSIWAVLSRRTFGMPKYWPG